MKGSFTNNYLGPMCPVSPSKAQNNPDHHFTNKHPLSQAGLNKRLNGSVDNSSKHISSWLRRVPGMVPLPHSFLHSFIHSTNPSRVPSMAQGIQRSIKQTWYLLSFFCFPENSNIQHEKLGLFISKSEFPIFFSHIPKQEVLEMQGIQARTSWHREYCPFREGC